jgi:molecular chaperone HscA
MPESTVRSANRWSLVEVRVSRADFELETAELTQRTLGAVRKALRDAKLRATKSQGVVLVGGSTRMPQVRAAPSPISSAASRSPT